jgi:hypothetical protein
MSARISFPKPACLIVLLLGLGGPSLHEVSAQDVADAATRPDFSGVWVFNEARSDDLRQLVEEAVGPGYTQGDAKREVVRVWIRKWLLGVLDDPDSRYLTIEQSARDFKTGLGDEVSIYYFGREASSTGPGGGTLKVTVAWKGSQLLTEERSEDGGRIASLYTMLPGGDTLIVAYLLEHKTLPKALEARMFFDRDQDAD